MTEEFRRRISFDAATETMEADFSDFVFEDAAMTDAFYDEIERLIAASGDDRWYFLVNLNGARIEPAAWMTYGARGRRLNEEHSLGSVRFDASEETKREIERRAEAEEFDANLCETREQAVERIAHLRSIAPKRFRIQPRIPSQWGREEFARRVTLHEDLQAMEADFSDFTFETPGDVHDFYDYLDHAMRVTGKKWFFVVIYSNTRIMPEVWGAFHNRGKKLNMDFSLGSVRVDPSPETAAEIERRANTDEFDPNLFTTRDAAFARIRAIRSEVSVGA